MTLTNHLGSDIWIVPCMTSLTAEDLEQIFFVHWYCKDSLPLDIISDRDQLFISHFWQALHKLTGTKLKMSTSYHPEMDGASKQMNKAINQCIHFHIERNQRGWVKSLTVIHFNLMSTLNKSTGFTPFEFRLGQMPQILPPLTNIPKTTDRDVISTANIIRKIQLDSHLTSE